MYMYMFCWWNSQSLWKVGIPHGIEGDGGLEGKLPESPDYIAF
jgi:hypothetical protein